jgi:hypothetical protein
MVVRLSRIPAAGRELLRAPRRAVHAGTCRNRNRRLGSHPPGPRSQLAADRIIGCADDGAVWPVVDLLAHTLPEVTEVASGEQTGPGPARPHIYLTAFREPGARALARAAAPVIAQDPPERRHAVTDLCPRRSALRQPAACPYRRRAAG